MSVDASVLERPRVPVDLAAPPPPPPGEASPTPRAPEAQSERGKVIDTFNTVYSRFEDYIQRTGLAAKQSLTDTERQLLIHFNITQAGRKELTGEDDTSLTEGVDDTFTLTWTHGDKSYEMDQRVPVEGELFFIDTEIAACNRAIKTAQQHGESEDSYAGIVSTITKLTAEKELLNGNSEPYTAENEELDDARHQLEAFFIFNDPLRKTLSAQHDWYTAEYVLANRRELKLPEGESPVIQLPTDEPALQNPYIHTPPPENPHYTMPPVEKLSQYAPDLTPPSPATTSTKSDKKGFRLPAFPWVKAGRLGLVGAAATVGVATHHDTLHQPPPPTQAAQVRPVEEFGLQNPLNVDLTDGIPATPFASGSLPPIVSETQPQSLDELRQAPVSQTEHQPVRGKFQEPYYLWSDEVVVKPGDTLRGIIEKRLKERFPTVDEKILARAASVEVWNARRDNKPISNRDLIHPEEKIGLAPQRVEAALIAYIEKSADTSEFETFDNIPDTDDAQKAAQLSAESLLVRIPSQSPNVISTLTA